MQAGRRRVRGELRGLADEGTVLVQRQADLTPSLSLEKLAASGRRLVYDVDDAIWLDGSQAPGRHRLARLKGTPRKARWLAERADQVIAGNEILAEQLGRWSEHVAVVPSLVDPEALPVRKHADGEELVIGWIGSPVNTAYLDAVLPAIRQVAEGAGRPVRLLTVGAGPLRVEGIELEQHPWSEDAERSALERMDAGLMPMPDTAWTRGKCAYKALVYMGSGVPVVADDVGVTADAVGEGGYVVPAGEPRAAAWAERLGELESDADLRDRLGAAGRRKVERDYSVRAWAQALARLIRPA